MRRGVVSEVCGRRSGCVFRCDKTRFRMLYDRASSRLSLLKVDMGSTRIITTNRKENSALCRCQVPAETSIEMDVQVIEADKKSDVNVPDDSLEVIEKANPVSEEDLDSGQQGIEEDLYSTSSIISNLFKDIESSKAARENLERTKQQQIFNHISTVESELDAGMKRMKDIVKKAENDLQLEIKRMNNSVNDKVDNEVQKLKAALTESEHSFDSKITSAIQFQERQLHESVKLSNERVALLQATVTKAIEESQNHVKDMVDDLNNRMTENDVSTRDHIVKLLSSRCDSIEATILTEETKRIEEDKNITATIDIIVNRLKEEFENDLNMMKQESGQNLKDVEQDLLLVMEKDKSEMEIKNHTVQEWIKGALEEVVKELSDEKNIRLQDEAKILKSVGDDLLLVNKRVSDESQSREEQMNRISSLMEDYLKEQQIHQQELLKRVVELECSMKQKVDEEKRERINEDKKMISAMNEYTKALQESLRTINS